MFPPGKSSLLAAVISSRNTIALTGVFAVILVLSALAVGQSSLPYLTAGPNSAFAQLDYARAYLADQIRDVSAKEQFGQLVDSNSVSVLDLEAPDKAVSAFNEGTELLREQKPKDAARYFQRAIHFYPDFVSAHTALAFAYLDQRDARAAQEFEVAAKLDESVAGPFMDLGMLALSNNDFEKANLELEKAASLSPTDAAVLSALAFAQYSGQRYGDCLQTVEKVHRLSHRRMANVHYIAAAAAMALHDFTRMRSELNTFITEDPTNPLTPIAHKSLESLAYAQKSESLVPTSGLPANAGRKAQLAAVMAADGEHLREELRGLTETDSDSCDGCAAPSEAPPATTEELRSGDWNAIAPASNRQNLFTIHEFVDETALFFSVSDHGRPINNLSISNIRVEDNDKPPAKVLDFLPQSKRPLRLGLLIDRSGSVEHRFTFEKRAAERFLQRVLNGNSDLAFVAGFDQDVEVTQDFTNDPALLAQGIEKLTEGDQTSVFDAVNFGCWKLAAYPDQQRVAKVLVVLTDGEDNSSHRSLRQALEIAEASGVTIYTLSTSERANYKTDAGQILQAMAEHSGGDALFPGTLRALDRYLDKLPEVIRNRYLIAYRAANFTADGRYRKVHIKAAKDGKNLRVNVRRGYYARLAMNQ